MSGKEYRVHFYFDIGDIFRIATVHSERIIEEKGLQHRVNPIDITGAWLRQYLEYEMAIVVQPTEHSWAEQFIGSELANDQNLKILCYYTFSGALHPALHPCFHHACVMVVSPYDLKLEYTIPNKDSP